MKAAEVASASARSPGAAVTGATLGLAFGILEGLGVFALSLIPGALNWRTANSFHALWITPLVYAAVFAILAVLIALPWRLRRRPAPAAPLVFVLVFLGIYLLGRLPNVLLGWACAVLAIGVAGRAYTLSKRWRPGAMRYALSRLGGAVLALLLVCSGFALGREAWRMRRLPQVTGSPPNVLLLLIDTQRADHLSAYGYERPTSPNLDAIGAEGVLFEAAYSHSSWTLPSHVSLFTGLPQHEHRAGVMRQPYMARGHATLAEVLARAGFATAGFVANTYWAGRQTGLARGFIHYEDFYGRPADVLLRTTLGRVLTYEVVPKLIPVIDMPGRKRADELNGDLLDWLDGIGERPFFAFVNYFDVHKPYFPPPETRGRFGWTPPRGTGEIDIGAITGKEQEAVDTDNEIAGYDESILALDAAIGRLRSELVRRGVWDRTLVIITSDHGEAFGENGIMSHGQGLWQSQVRVPLILRYPAAIPPGLRVSAAVGNDGIAATITELLELDRTMPGLSLTGAWRDPAWSPGPVIVEEGHRWRGTEVPAARGWVAGVADERFHLVMEQSGDFQVYDLASDPGGLEDAKNLHDHPRIREWRDQLRSMDMSGLEPAIGPLGRFTDFVANSGRDGPEGERRVASSAASQQRAGNGLAGRTK